MIETRIYCDVCDTELTEQFPGEDFTTVPVKEAIKRHHKPSKEEIRKYHLCADEVEPMEFRSSHFYRAGNQIPMMLLTRMGYDYVPRSEFSEDHDRVAEVLERAWE